jgi:hypothetical protein
VVLVLLGSTAYDSVAGSLQWIRLMQRSTLPPEVLGTLGLAASVAVIALAYLLAVHTARVVGSPHRPPVLFAHSLLPIALGYVIAHYFTLAVLQGPRTVILAADPLGTGHNLLGLSPSVVSSSMLLPAAVAALQVAAVVAGHITGAVAAHDRAVRLFPPETARWGQLPLLLLMVGYTYLGLTLLFAG